MKSKKYQEYMHDFELYNTEQVELLFQNLDRNKDKERLLLELSRVIENLSSRVNDLKPINFGEAVRDLINDNDVNKTVVEGRNTI